MAKLDKSKIRTISIIIHWCEADTEIGGYIPICSHMEAALREPQAKNIPAQDRRKHNTLDKRMRSPRKRMLPSDRVVLEALRARLPSGEQVTTPVRTREIMEVCEISRRQVQICLRRLIEKGYIKRLLQEDNLGNHTGHQYKLMRHALLTQS